VCACEQNGVLSNRINLKGITNANSGIQMFSDCKATAQLRKALHKCNMLHILVFAQQSSFLMLKSIFFTACLSGRVRKWRKHVCVCSGSSVLVMTEGKPVGE